MLFLTGRKWRRKVEEQGAYEEVRVKEVQRKRILNNVKHPDLQLSLTIIRVIKLRRMRWAGNVARFGEDRNENMAAVEKPEGKKPLGRPRCRRDYTKIQWKGISWIHSTQGKLAGSCEVGNGTSIAVQCEVFLNHLKTLTLS